MSESGTRSTSATNNNNNNKESRRAEIRLPNADYQLYCWKVRHRASVRQGETVALAIRKQDVALLRVGDNNDATPLDNNHTATTTTNSTIATPETHAATATTTIKRATKRKRIPSTASSTTSAAAMATEPTTTASSSSNTTTTTAKETTHAKAPLSSVLDKTYPILSPADGIVQIRKDLVADDDTHSDDPMVLAYVTACTHPTVVDGLCAVCGAPYLPKPEEEEEGGNSNHSNTTDRTSTTKMSRVTVGGGVTVAISQQEGQRMAEQDVYRLHKAKKLALILDLDHTLVHATNDMRALPFAQQRDDVRTLLLPVLVEKEAQQPQQQSSSSRWVWMQHFIKLRPHVVDFFQMVSPCYEIGVYTAGTREYAEQITILLSRQLVGAKHDQVDLDHLRHAVYKMQMELIKQQHEQQQQPQNDTGENNDNDNDNNINDMNNASLHTDNYKGTPTDNDDDQVKTAPALTTTTTTTETTTTTLSSSLLSSSPKKKTKKRVTFGEAPAAAKSDRATPQELEVLQQELAEAERLEGLAMEMRQRLFGGRVVSRSDVKDLGQNVKSLKRIFPCGGSMAAVVDDREDVWANATDVTWAQRPGEPPDNLLLVKPYHWDRFMGFADVNNAAGVDLTERFSADGTKDKEGKRGNGDVYDDDVENDEQLLWTADILKRLHERYYSYFQQQQQGNGMSEDDVARQNRPSANNSVPEILRSMRHQVLQGKKIVLSGLIPLHKQNQQHELSKPRAPIVRYVENLGAVLVPQIVPTVTHVVGIKDGTDKIIAARKSVKGCKIVKLAWLMECVWSLTKRKEEPHFLGPRAASDSGDSGNKQPLMDSTRNNSSDSSNADDDDDGDEDDLAAEFENELMSET